MHIQLCREISGGTLIRNGIPNVEVMRNAVLIPMGQHQKPGVYDSDGQLLRSAAYFRGLPTPHFPLEGEATDLHRRTLPVAPLSYRYYFAGHLTGHYGHFLFSVISRLWALPNPVPADMKLVLLNSANAAEIFQLTFAKEIFGALGISVENIAVFRDPIQFSELIVAEAAIEENHQAYPQFAELCHRIGTQLLDVKRQVKYSRPVFLSKRFVKSGVHHVTNEAIFCNILERHGIQVVSPECLSFGEQIRIWAEAPTIGGIFGSMLHTSVFMPNRRYVALNPEVWINSNQILIDKINGNDGRVFFPIDGYQREKDVDDFAHALRMKDPVGVAIDFCRLMSDPAPKLQNIHLLGSIIKRVFRGTARN